MEALQTNGSNGYSSGAHERFDSANHQTTMRDYLAMLYKSRWWITTIFLTTMSTVAYVTYTTPPIYQASTTIMIDKKQGVGQSLFAFTGYGNQRTHINNQVQILKSRSLAEAVIEKLLHDPARDSLAIVRDVGRTRSRFNAAGRLRGSISIAPIRDTDLIRILLKAPSAFEAVFLVNAVAEVYKELERDFSRGEISQVVEFLDEQLSRKEGDLKTSEDALKAFLEHERISSLDDEATQVVAQSAEFESRYKGVLVDLEVTMTSLEYLKGQLGRSKEKLEFEIARVSSPMISRLRAEMADIERNIAVYLSQGVNDSDLQVRREHQKMAGIKSRLTLETRKLIVAGLPADDPLALAQGLVVKILQAETEIISLNAKSNALKEVVDSYAKQMEALPDRNVRLARLERNQKVDESLYMMMREKYEESRITQAGQIGMIRIIDAAVPPSRPISPQTKLNLLLGVIVGLGLGFGFTFLREYFDTSVRRIEDIEAMGLPVLGAIPSIEPIVSNGHPASKGDKQWLENTEEAQRRLVTYIKPKSPVSEAYRSLRTNIQFSKSDDPVKQILVSSSGPGEGKSTTTANIAITMSQQGNRTLLVDTDLRRPVQHRLFGKDKNVGLTTILVGDMKIEEAIQPTEIKNLDLLSCGILPPNPAEMLGSNKMKELVKELGNRYDYCLFDSPPLIAVTDAAVLARDLDGILLVVKSGRTHRDAVVRGVELLDNVQARILGVLLNDVSRENTYGSYYYYYYYHYYYYYGESGDKQRKKKRGSRSGLKSLLKK